MATSSDPGKATPSGASRQSSRRWIDVVARDPVPWLLDPSNPSVRTLTLTHIFKRSAARLAEEQQRILAWKPIASLNSHWDAINFWGRGDNPYYGGPVGNFGTLYLFAQLGVPQSPQIAAACENLLIRGRHSAGYFAPEDTSAAPWLCYTGIALQILTHFGYDEDPRTLAVWEILGDAVRDRPDDLECTLADRVCRAAAVKALGALIHRDGGASAEAGEEVIDLLCHYLLDHVYAWDQGDADWLLPRFPRYYDADVIELCHVLAHTEARSDPRTQALLQRMLALQDAMGRWSKLKATPAFSEERIFQPSRWLTFEAIHSLMLIYGDDTYAA